MGAWRLTAQPRSPSRRHLDTYIYCGTCLQTCSFVSFESHNMTSRIPLPRFFWFWFLPLLPIIAPVVLIMNHHEKRDDEKRNGTRAPPGSKPVALKTRSRRPLTPPLPQPSSFMVLRKAPNYDEQVMSPIFSRLPAELRAMVWKECLQTMVHVFWRNGHMLGAACQLDKSAFSDHSECYSRARHGMLKGNHGDVANMRGRLALLLTCRRL